MATFITLSLPDVREVYVNISRIAYVEELSDGKAAINFSGLDDDCVVVEENLGTIIQRITVELAAR